MATTAWFSRLGEVPRVEYKPPVSVNRTRLPGQNARPTITHFDFGGRHHEFLSWPRNEGGSTSQSPANQYETARSGDKLSSSDVLRHLYDVLELPGVLSDYHFAIQRCAEELWSRRREEPEVLADVERLCWLDISLLEAHPDLFDWNSGDAKSWPTILGFGYLIRLYSREGHLREAFDVATRASRFQQHQSDRDSLQQRIDVLAGEEEVWFPG